MRSSYSGSVIGPKMSTCTLPRMFMPAPWITRTLGIALSVGPEWWLFYLTDSAADADDLLPVGGVLVGVRDAHDERIVEEAADDLHADRKADRRYADRQSERRMAGEVEGQGVAVAASTGRQQIVLDGLEVRARPVVLGRRHDAG